MRISKRLETLTPQGDDGWGVYYKAMAMKAAGVPILNLTIGEHDTRTDPAILDAMHASARGGHTGYAAVPGIAALRRAVADRTQRMTGVPTGPENVLITPGGQSALFAAHMLACNPGDTALYLDPYYVTYPGTLRAAGTHAVAIATRPEDGFQPRASDIAPHAKAATSLLINSPNNPTGTVYSAETLADVADLCRTADLWLISDEVYDAQVWTGPHLSPRALPDMQDRCLVVGSLSKSHAMTGSRLGWLIGPADAIAAASNLATHTTYGVPGFIQDAGVFALAQGPVFEREIAAPFRRRRDMVMAMLDPNGPIRAVPSDGAMYTMLDIRATGLGATAFCLQALEQRHIATLPGDSFGQAAAGHIRIALTLPDPQLRTALASLLDFATGLCAPYSASNRSATPLMQ